MSDRWPFVGPLGVLLHVFLQVRLLRVALAAVLTDVGLQMLALLVLGNVLEQRRLVAEALVARVALVRLVCLMAPRVRLQVAQLGERLLATRMSTPRTKSTIKIEYCLPYASGICFALYCTYTKVRLTLITFPTGEALHVAADWSKP